MCDETVRGPDRIVCAGTYKPTHSNGTYGRNKNLDFANLVIDNQVMCQIPTKNLFLQLQLSKKIAQLFTVGKLSENASRGFGEGARHFADQASLVEHLKQIANKDTTMLIKGSRSAAMDLVVRQLCDSAEGAH